MYIILIRIIFKILAIKACYHDIFYIRALFELFNEQISALHEYIEKKEIEYKSQIFCFNEENGAPCTEHYKKQKEQNLANMEAILKTLKEHEGHPSDIVKMYSIFEENHIKGKFSVKFGDPIVGFRILKLKNKLKNTRLIFTNRKGWKLQLNAVNENYSSRFLLETFPIKIDVKSLNDPTYMYKENFELTDIGSWQLKINNNELDGKKQFKKLSKIKI